MRFLSLLFVLLLGCASTGTFSEPHRAYQVSDMMASTVKIFAVVKYQQVLSSDPGAGTPPILSPEIDSEKHVGSGVVYARRTWPLPVTSRILTANHVLDVPTVGEIVNRPVKFAGITIEELKYQVVAVELTAITYDDQVCALVPLTKGDNEDGDVVTAELDCDAGVPVQVADAEPKPGDKVFIVGHPLGIPVPLVTEGYLAGVSPNNFLVSSAPASTGNSGGAMFFRGQIVGILTRVASAYDHITFSVRPEKIRARIKETPL